MNNIKFSLISVGAVYIKLENVAAVLHDQTNATSEMKTWTLYSVFSLKVYR